MIKVNSFDTAILSDIIDELIEMLIQYGASKDTIISTLIYYGFTKQEIKNYYGLKNGGQ